ncbi:hypothetical protein MAH1_08430 [Sessilibacter sp. MAH1]|mgnify:CR=1 FL=1
MVHSRKEPTLSSSDLTTTLDDEPRASATRKAVPPAPGSAPRQPSSNQTASHAATHRAPPTVVKSNSPLAGFSLFVGFLGLGLAGFAFWMLTQAQAQFDEQMKAAESRITGLEQRLELSDDESTQSVTALQANLKKAVEDIRASESEIRKLWDTRNVNKDAIAENTKAIAGAKSASAQASKKLEDQLARQQISQTEKVALIEKELASLTTQQNTLAAKLQNTAGLDALRNQVKTLETKLAALDQLSTRVISNEEAIDAIDAYRLNINRQLLELQQKVSTP